MFVLYTLVHSDVMAYRCALPFRGVKLGGLFIEIKTPEKYQRSFCSWMIVFLGGLQAFFYRAFVLVVLRNSFV